MQHTLFSKPILVLTLFLALIAGAVGVSAYDEPLSQYPANTYEPIDTGMAGQAKFGPLTIVSAFFARGNSDFKKDLTIEGVAQGGNPGDTTSSVAVGSNVLTVGELRAGGKLAAVSLRHNESSPKPVCGDANGIVVFCTDVCPNIDGAQATIPNGNIIDASGNCVPKPDICRNVAGVKELSADITIEDPSDPTFCTQTIRGTVTVGHQGTIARNMAGNAELANLWITKLKIVSVGGNTAITTWPDPSPLKFRWGYCGAWNPAYTSGPNKDNGGAVFYNIIGSLATGFCDGFVASYANGSTLPYGRSGYADSFLDLFPYVGYDSTTQTVNINKYPVGFFDAKQYDKDGTKTKNPGGFNVNLWYLKNHPTDPYRNIKFPVEKVVLYDVVVPKGYKLILTGDTVTTKAVEMYLK